MVNIYFKEATITTHTIPSIELNNGILMPQFGLGVWQTNDGDEVISAVDDAINAGYRLIDTAAIYGNEAGVGQAIRQNGIKREELFITTKLWNSEQGYDSTLKAFNESMNKLGLEYLDLYLIHWPSPKNDKYVETWKAFEKLYADGRVKAIGVSNFHPEHLKRLAQDSSIVPAVNQIELHPHLLQTDTRKYASDNGIQIESWSPLGGSASHLMRDPVLEAIAATYEKSVAQVLIRWHIQNGLIVIPKSVHKERIEQNIDVFDFELSGADMDTINNLGTEKRYGPNPDTASF